MKPEMNAIGKQKFFICWLTTMLAACSSAYPPRDTSTIDKINLQLKQAAVPSVQAVDTSLPDAVNAMLLPPAKMARQRVGGRPLDQRFDLVIKDAPVEDVLMGIVLDTPYSIMLKPKSQIPTPLGTATPSTGTIDRVTLNLKDVTVFRALDAMREVYGYDYTVEGNLIYVQQPELQTRLYQVNYIIGQRRGVSDMQVIGGASVGSSSSAGSSSTASTGSTASSTTSPSSYSSVQASALSSISKSDVWGEVEDTLRTTLGCQIPKNMPGRVGGSTATGTRADVSFVGDVQSGERQRGVDGCLEGRAISINQMSGTIMVRSMPNEHRMIEKMLRSMQLNIDRQVIIEAKIIDVQLNSTSQQGINWAGFQNNVQRFSVGANAAAINGTTTNGGAINAGTSLGALLGGGVVAAATAGNAISSAGLGLAVQFRNFSALISFLQTQGSVHVLSSPRIATLNSQKAVLKVGSEEPFVTNINGGSVSTATGVTVNTPPTLNYQPFFSGISLDVTPQIDDKGNITLHVHSMVNSIVEKQKVSMPAAGAALVPFAVNTISETDSVVKTKDGQVVVIGGLMTQSNLDSRAKVPGLGDVPAVGALFSNGGQNSLKRELVILLKPTVVKDESAWTDDIAATQGRIEIIGDARRK